MKLDQQVYMSICQSNTSRAKTLNSWLHFNNEPRVQGKQQVQDHQSYMPVFIANDLISHRPIFFLEMSHRSKAFVNICREAENDIRSLV